jgi:hypothetical protein
LVVDKSGLGYQLGYLLGRLCVAQVSVRLQRNWVSESEEKPMNLRARRPNRHAPPTRDSAFYARQIKAGGSKALLARTVFDKPVRNTEIQYGDGDTVGR